MLLSEVLNSPNWKWVRFAIFLSLAFTQSPEQRWYCRSCWNHLSFLCLTRSYFGQLLESRLLRLLMIYLCGGCRWWSSDADNSTKGIRSASFGGHNLMDHCSVYTGSLWYRLALRFSANPLSTSNFRRSPVYSRDWTIPAKVISVRKYGESSTWNVLISNWEKLQPLKIAALAIETKKEW